MGRLGTRRLGAGIVAIVLSVLLATSASAGTATRDAQDSRNRDGTVREQMLDHVREKAREAGGEPAEILDAPTTLTIQHADGSVEEQTTTLREMVELVVSEETRTSSHPVGGETVAGDILHLYLNTNIGGSALAYDVHTSQTVPATPPLVVPAEQAGVTVFDVGGPTRNVEGSYDLGFHTAGSTFGSNVDTTGPYLPYFDRDVLVTDTSLDFVGHAVVAQAESCLFGVCAALGTMFSTGTAIFDGEIVGFPNVP